MSSADSASRFAPGLTRPGKVRERACSAISRVVHLAGALCLAVSLTSCAAHAIAAQNAPKPSAPPRAPVKIANRQPQPFAVDDDDSPIAPAIVSLVRRIYAAAAHSDYASLGQLLKNNCPYPGLGQDGQVKLVASSGSAA